MNPTTSARKVRNVGCVKQPAKRDTSSAREPGTCGIGGDLLVGAAARLWRPPRGIDSSPASSGKPPMLLSRHLSPDHVDRHQKRRKSRSQTRPLTAGQPCEETVGSTTADHRTVAEGAARSGGGPKAKGIVPKRPACTRAEPAQSLSSSCPSPHCSGDRQAQKRPAAEPTATAGNEPRAAAIRGPVGAGRQRRSCHRARLPTRPLLRKLVAHSASCNRVRDGTSSTV
jgi:hypothetical protein